MRPIPLPLLLAAAAAAAIAAGDAGAAERIQLGRRTIIRPGAAPAAAPAPEAAGEDELRADIPPGCVKLKLKDGSVVPGRLADPEFAVETEFGLLKVPSSEIRWVKIGMASDPELIARIQRLIEKLGNPTYAKRTEAREELKRIGLPAYRSLEQAERHEDMEVQNSARDLLAELQQGLGDETPPRDEDEIVTARFTLVGLLGREAFKVDHANGTLVIPKSKIEKILGPMDRGERTRVQIGTDSLAGFGRFVRTPVVVRKGDRLRVLSRGSVTVGNWNQTFGPEGLSQDYGTFEGRADLPAGSLVGRIGTKGRLFYVGPSFSRPVDEEGTLYLAVALQRGVNVAGSFEADVWVEGAGKKTEGKAPEKPAENK